MMVYSYYCARKSLDDGVVPCFRCMVMCVLEAYQNNLSQPLSFKIWVGKDSLGGIA